MKIRINKQFILFTLLLPLTTVAQQTDTLAIHEVLIHENRLQVPFSKQNRNIDYLTAEEIRKIPARSLNEVLSFMQGVDVRQRGPFGTQADISIDGGTFEQTLILVNGIKVTDPQTAHHNMNLPIPLEAIERIEILRGPAARIYGTNALTGAINIITKTMDKTELNVHLYGGSSFQKVEPEEGKSGRYYGSGIQIGGSLAKENHGHQLYYTKEKTNGQRYNTAAANDKVFYQGTARIDEKNQIDWLGSYMHNEFGANGYYAAPGDKEAAEIVQTVLASISSKHQLHKNWNISPRITARYNKDDYRYFRHDLSKSRSLHENHSISGEINSRYQTRLGDIGLGWESRSEKISSSNIGDHSRVNHGAFAEFRTEYFRNLVINAGAYVNYNSQFGWQVYPGIDIGYAFHPRWRLLFNTGSSQRIPSYTDLYLDQRPGNIGNADLRTEEAWQMEGALKYKQGNFTAYAGYFYRNISHFIDWVRDIESEPYQAFHVGDNRVHGVNTKFNYQLAAGDFNYSFSLGYNYLNPSLLAEDGKTSKYQLRMLKHQANAVINLRYKDISITTANRFHERQSTANYFLSDLRLGYSLQQLHLYTDIQNIFNVQYMESNAVPMPGRWVSLGIKYKI